MVTHWRKSTLKTLLEGCSWQWALQNVYNLDDHGSPQTSLGTGYHKAMEMYELNGRKNSLEELQSFAAESAFDECRKLPVELWFEHELDPQWVVDMAKEAVRLWWEQPTTKEGFTLKSVADSRKFVAAEKHFVLEPASGMPGLSGTIDAIYEDDDNYILVDHKTASSFRKWTYEQDATIEAAVYLQLAQQEYVSKPLKFEWHVTSHKEQKVRLIDGGTFTQEAHDVLLASTTTADVIVNNHAFRPRPDWNLCSPKWCAYFQGCRIDGTLSPYQLTTSNVPNLDTPR